MSSSGEVIFDLETDGLLEDVTKIHLIQLREREGPVRVYHDSPEFPRDGTVLDGLGILSSADTLIGHNIDGYDIPVLQKLHPSFDWSEARVLDTLVYARLVYPDTKPRDASRAGFLPHMRGSHSLKAWGLRLGFPKGDFNGPWDKLTQEMIDYGIRDVEVTTKLLEVLEKQSFSEQSIGLEHDFASAIREVERNGVYFDVGAAEELTRKLLVERAHVDDVAAKAFGPRRVKKYKRAPKALVPGEHERDENGDVWKLEPFNPGSRLQVAWNLKQRYGWEPDTLTPTGKPKIDETTLATCSAPEAAVFAERFMLTKLLGQVAEGSEAWLKCVKDGRIHGRITHNGAVTGRCTHQRPNLAQVPRLDKPYGRDCRSLFTVPEGHLLVGCDASRLELVCLAHYLHPFDGGRFADILQEGDAHAENQKAAGLATRDEAKTFIYAFLYGAGDAKIGSIIGKGARAGRAIKKRFMERTPGLAKLIGTTREKAERTGWLDGIDGRRVRVRHLHAALNTQLQSCGAIVMKKATVLCQAFLRWKNVTAKMVLHVHDEFQLEVRAQQAELAAHEAKKSIRLAAESLRLKCPLDADARIGKNWSETH